MGIPISVVLLTFFSLAVDFAAIAITLGVMMLAFKAVRASKGGVLESGIRMLAISPVFVILSVLVDAIFENSQDVFTIIDDLILLAFVLWLYWGCRSLIVSWRNYTTVG
jgi:hypothetical protein